MSGIRNIAAIPFAQDIDVANTVNTYAAGQQIGGVLTLMAPAPFLSGDNGPILIVQTAILTDEDNQKSAVDVLLFRGVPTSSGDNTAYAPNAADMALLIGKISFPAADWATYGTMAAVVVRLVEAMRIANGKLYAIVVSQGAPTFVSAGVLKLKVAGVVS